MRLEGTMRELATDRTGLEILHLGDCYSLLGSVPVGRIGFIEGDEAVILPVSFVLDGQDIVFTTGARARLSAVEVGHYVTFEADSYDQQTGACWSVTAMGLAEIIGSAEEAARLDALGLMSWSGSAERVWVRIRPAAISGRRSPARPAGHDPATAG
jgi:nitroimidazol reductase NimA-like FMN-containing flavoprotein (pyridoxamine 5'-phosphate oxidase superfamily)